MLPKPLRLGLYILILGAASIIFCYWFIDRPLVYFANTHQLRSYTFLEMFTHIPDYIHTLVLVLYPILIVRYCYQKQARFDRVGFVFANSVAIAYYLKGLLKNVFGRYWPETFQCNNLSLLRDHLYGFKPFHSGVSFAAFPSGHTTVVVAAATILWIAYPRWRWLALLMMVLVVTGLLGNYYHFLGDVIAGGMLGFLTAYYIAKIMKL